MAAYRIHALWKAISTSYLIGFDSRKSFNNTITLLWSIALHTQSIYKPHVKETNLHIQEMYSWFCFINNFFISLYAGFRTSVWFPWMALNLFSYVTFGFHIPMAMSIQHNINDVSLLTSFIAVGHFFHLYEQGMIIFDSCILTGFQSCFVNYMQWTTWLFSPLLGF